MLTLTEETRLKCPPEFETATGHFDPSGDGTGELAVLCAGCGIHRTKHIVVEAGIDGTDDDEEGFDEDDPFGDGQSDDDDDFGEDGVEGDDEDYLEDDDEDEGGEPDEDDDEDLEDDDEEF